MNFFEQQDRVKKKTKRLVFFFLLAILGILACIHAIIYGTLYYASLHDPSLLHYLKQPLWIPITATTLTVILLGTLLKVHQMKAGGQAVAKLSGAVPFPKTLSFEEKRFVNVVEEMSIASGVAMPTLYLLEDPAINAFVAGLSPQDTVMVVTRGALNNFNRDELQAVVGHEFSHIYNGDMAFNLKLIGLLGGILWISLLGEILLRMKIKTSVAGKKGGSAFLMFFMGLGLYLIGYMGLLFARMIKAAIARQRELLADACSVQYTRYPQALVSAFKTMQAHQEGSVMKSTHREEISHLCFGQAMHFSFSSLFDTHPSLSDRIKAIDPQQQYDRLPRDSV